MKKYILLAVTAIAFVGAAFATQTLQTKPTLPVKKPMVRPALKNLLDKRPALPVKTTTVVSTGKVFPLTGNTVISTGKDVKTTGSIVRQIVQQNAEDVKAYREENGYIVRYLKTPTREEKLAFGEAVIKAVKDFLATQKSMRQAYEAGIKSKTLMTKEQWDTQTDAAIAIYKAAVLPYIDAAKMAEFEKFIIGRTNLMKALFDKLETIRTTKK